MKKYVLLFSCRSFSSEKHEGRNKSTAVEVIHHNLGSLFEIKLNPATSSSECWKLEGKKANPQLSPKVSLKYKY